MNERIVSIAYELARNNRSYSLDALANEYSVSARTIRNDLKSLNSFLEGEGLSQLEYGPGGLIVVSPDFSRVTTYLPVQGFYSYKMSSDERKILAAVILAEESDYVTLASIADRFSVSRATILNDLEGIKTLIREAGLEVVSKPAYGLRVRGDEQNRRRFLLEFAVSDSPIVEQWAQEPERKILQSDVVTIGKILNEQGHLHSAVLDDYSFKVAQSYLCIAVRRCRVGGRIERISSRDSCAREEVRSYARDVIGLLAQYCSVEMDEVEANGFAAVLKSSGFRSDLKFSIEDVRVQTVTRTFVEKVSLACGVDLNGDYDLFECLSNHLESMFSSDASRFPVNPSLREVVTDQPQILDAVKDNLSILEAYSKRRITEVETIYVTLHICAALERRKNAEARVRVIIICDEGVGTSQLVAEDLRGRFDIRIVKMIPAHEIPYLDTCCADLVISTVPLKDCPIDSVVASLPLTDRDYAHISTKIDKARCLGRTHEACDELGSQGLLDRIEPILVHELSNGQESLIRQIRTEVRRYFHETQHMEKEILNPYLYQLLPPDHIQLDVTAADWRDAVAQSARPLIEQGFIELCYVDAMIKNVEDHGPYIVLVPHFAIPHEAPEGGVHKLGMSLIRLKEPVEFGAGNYDPVEFVCTLSPIDHKTHLKAFFNLLTMLSKDDLSVIQKLHRAKTPNEVASLIESLEYYIIK